MNGIVVVGHNHFAEGVVSAGEMILGPQEHVKYVCLKHLMKLLESMIQ